MKITRVDFLKVGPKVTGSKNSKWLPGTPEKSTIAHNFQRNAPRIFILVSTLKFLCIRNSKEKIIKNFNASKCAEIQDGRNANIEDICLLTIFCCPTAGSVQLTA